MKRLAIAVLAVLGLCGSSHAQGLVADRFFLAAVRDYDNAAFEYCATTGVNGTTSDRSRPGRGFLSAAASTTVTCDGSAGCFTNIAVGDILFVNESGVIHERGVATRASANSITVTGAALTLTGAAYNWRKLVCGTADTNGAFPVAGAHSFSIHLILAQENSTSTDYQVECRVDGPGEAWSIVTGPINDTGVFNDIWSTDLAFSKCRVGVRVNGDDGGDTGVNAEQYTLLVLVRR